MTPYSHCGPTHLRVAGSRRRRQSVVRAIGIVLVAGALVVSGAPGGAAARSERGEWGAATTIMGGIRLGKVGPAVQLPDGNAVALWQRSGRDTLFWAQRRADRRWSAPAELGGDSSTIWTYDAIEEPGSRITAVWRGTNDVETGIWSQRFVAGEWTEPHFEVPTTGPSGFLWVRLATARRVTALMWAESTAGDGEEIKIAVSRASGDMTILPPLPDAGLYRYELSVDGEGRPTVVGATDDRVVVTTYGSDGWVEEQVGPSPGYELPSLTPHFAAASNRSGDLAVGWREVLIGSGPSDPGTTIVRHRPRGEAFAPAHVLATESWCSSDFSCVPLGMAADGDLTAVYQVLVDGSLADVWITRRDATTQEWQAPQRLAHEVVPYAGVIQSTAPGGRSVVAISIESGVLAFRCDAAAHCGAPVEMAEPDLYNEVVVDGAKGRAVMLWGAGCAFECEYFSTLRARVFK